MTALQPKFQGITLACDDSMTIQTHKVMLVDISTVWDCDNCGKHVRTKNVSWIFCPAGPPSLATKREALLLCPAGPAALAPPALQLRPACPASLATQRGAVQRWQDDKENITDLDENIAMKNK